MNPPQFLSWLKSRPQAMQSAFTETASRESAILAQRQRRAIQRRQGMQRAGFQREGMATSQQLENSVRVEKSANGYVIRAGGPSTTGPDGYDHALAKEFGTRHQAAQPFFYNTSRAAAPGIRKTLEDTIFGAFDSGDQ